uniref:MI domain-containing protein n=1 Tax=Amphimedon queenslandica TaxID=400682 RepID=A0A1X7T3S6_AMPQE
GNKGLELLKKGPPAHSSRRVVITHNPNKAEKVELRKAEQRWTRQAARGDAPGGDSTDPATEELFRKFQYLHEQLLSSSSNTSKKSSTTTTAGGRGSQPQATRRSQSDERSDTLKLVKDFLNPQPPPVTQATPTHTTSKQDRLTEEVVERKTTTIIDELSQNQDYKEAVECVIELESPGLMNVFVQTGINHSLEKSSAVRVSVGKLFDTLVAKDLLTTEKLISG